MFTYAQIFSFLPPFQTRVTDFAVSISNEDDYSINFAHSCVDIHTSATQSSLCGQISAPFLLLLWKTAVVLRLLGPLVTNVLQLWQNSVALHCRGCV